MGDITNIVTNFELLCKTVALTTLLDSKGFGQCPFHEEKTSSFHVFRGKTNRARFHCFGCGASGDVIDFIRRVENIDFAPAILRLTEINGGQIPISSSSLPGPASTLTSDIRPKPLSCEPLFCERDCEKCTNLREDYTILLEENERLRSELGLLAFQPSNERPIK